MNPSIKKLACWLTGFTLFSFLFLLIFSFSTSFIYDSYGFDSAIFMNIGKATSEGRQMYTEIFDHKGPVLFFIQYIGWSIGGVIGVFSLQVINLTVTLSIIYLICVYLKFNLKQTLLLLFSFLSLIAFTNIEGNQSEEYSLVFLFTSLLLLIFYLFNNNNIKHSPLFSLIYGVCFSLIAFNRITNAAPIGGIVMGIYLTLLFKQEWKNLLLNVVFFLFGIIIAITPIILHFYYYDSLQDMLFATFLFNLKYAGDSSGLFNKLFFIDMHDAFRYYVKASPNLLLIATAVILYTKNSIPLAGLLTSISIATLTYIAINAGLGSYHYVTINAIPLVLSIIFVIKIYQSSEIRLVVKIFTVSYTILMLLYFLYQDRTAYKVYIDTNIASKEEQGPNRYYVDVNLVNSLIKEDERNSVFGYNIPPGWYLTMDITPPFKYFVNQENWIKADSLIYYETNKYLSESKPTWIVIPEQRIAPWTVGVDSNPVLKSILEKNYKLEGKDLNHEYYRRKD